jgi:hypothetical protein
MNPLRKLLARIRPASKPKGSTMTDDPRNDDVPLPDPDSLPVNPDETDDDQEHQEDPTPERPHRPEDDNGEADDDPPGDGTRRR